MVASALGTINLLPKGSCMDLHPYHRSRGSVLYRTRPLSPRPRTSSSAGRTMNFKPGQQQTGVLGSGSSVPTPTMTSAVPFDRRTRSGAQCAAKQLLSWKIFLKYFVALLMGYDRTRETNLTKEKKMGFDLYSLGNHKTKNGEYFRNNVWWWRRLADFVCTHTGVVEEKDKPEWQSNGGHEVSEEQAMQIAKQLKALIKNGTVSKAIKEVEDEMLKAEENNKFVERCHDMLRDKVEKETGKENLAPADYPKDDHDTWDWIQSKYSYGSSYPFTMENVEQFIEFCEQSNGFRIC